MAGTTGPMNIDRRRMLVRNTDTNAGGDTLSGFAVVYMEHPNYPMTEQPPRHEPVEGGVITRPAEFEYRPDGSRELAQIEALGAIEVDNDGIVVEIVGYSRHLTGGAQRFEQLLRDQGWTVRLRNPPTHPPVAVTPTRVRDPR